MYRLATVNFVTDRQTNRQTEDRHQLNINYQ